MKRILDRPKFLIGIGIGLLILVSIYPLWRRHAAESRNLAVSVAVEYDVLETLAAGQGVSNEEAAAKLKASGFDTIVLSEETINDLIARGDIDLKSSSVPGTKDPTPIRNTSVLLNDLTAKTRVERGLRNRFDKLVGPMTVRDSQFSAGAIPQGLIRATSIGLNPDQVWFAKKNGFSIVVRGANFTGASEAAILRTIATYAETRPIAFLPLGDQVLGRKDLLHVTSRALASSQILYASAEFSKIAGDATMVAGAPENVVRLHTAQGAELDKLTRPGVVDRFIKAARERSHRILLVRPASMASAMPVDDFAALGNDIVQGLRKEGLVVAKPHAFFDPEVHSTYAKLMGPAGGLALTLILVGLVAKGWRTGALVLGLLLSGFGLTGIGKDLIALLVSIAAPAVAFALFASIESESGPRIVHVLKRILGVSFVSLAGGLYIAATMTGLPYMVQADTFSGVRIAVFLPVIIVGIYFLFRDADASELLRRPITYLAVVTTILLACILGVLVSRTGNDGLGASGLELTFRDVLENYFYVRPRTKEFLFGHPFAVFAFGWLLSGAAKEAPPRAVTALLMAMACIGQTGIVNTLCHGHIPLQLSLARILLGLVLGCIIGAGIWFVFEVGWNVYQRKRTSVN